jgi:uncharacterized protein (DUF302 family)
MRAICKTLTRALLRRARTDVNALPENRHRAGDTHGNRGVPLEARGLLFVHRQEQIMDDYGRRVILDMPFEAAVAATCQVFRDEGLDVVTRFDVRDYLLRTRRHECRRYEMLEALAPEWTLDALQHDPGIGPLLPVTVAIFELADGETAVVASPPFAPVLSDLAWRETTSALATIGDRASEQLARALDQLQRIARPSLSTMQP